MNTRPGATPKAVAHGVAARALYVTYGSRAGAAAFSADGGAGLWGPPFWGLPEGEGKRQVFALALDPRGPGTLYLSVTFGKYRETDFSRAAVQAVGARAGKPGARLTFATQAANSIVALAWDARRGALLAGGAAGALPGGGRIAARGRGDAASWPWLGAASLCCDVASPPLRWRRAGQRGAEAPMAADPCREGEGEVEDSNLTLLCSAGRGVEAVTRRVCALPCHRRPVGVGCFRA